MSGEYFYGVGRKGRVKGAANPARHDPRGTPATGRIAKLLVGQGNGFIRVHDREVFFHRGDLREGTAFNDLRIGDSVSFELLDDPVSGARALRVMRRRGQ
jgi:cold shock CspA family protein